MQQVDLAIVGGGLVGMSLAAALHSAPLKIALLEQQQSSEGLHIAALDTRTTGLSISSVRFFEAHGLWAQLSQFATPIYQLHINEENNFGSAKVKHQHASNQALGYMVPNQNLIEVLQKHLQQLSVVCVKSPFQLNTVSVHDKAYRLKGIGENQHAEVVEAKFVAACDGADSRMRNFLGIGCSQKAYRQSALIFNIQVAKPRANTAFERFTRNGPLAVLPVGEDRYAVIWTLAENCAQEYLQTDDEQFSQKLQTAFGYRLGSIVAVGKRVAYPLRLVVADQLTAWNAVLLGNAAQSLHPVAAQGFNLGLRDIQAFEVLLRRNQYQLSNIDELLAEYRQVRGKDRQRTIQLTDGLTRMFAASGRLSRIMRGVGITALGSSSLLQGMFLRRNMGVSYQLME